MADLENPTPTNGAVATPAVAEPTTTNGTVQPNGDAGTGQGASVEETFGNVDPRSLPPQLKAVYDNMLRGFKEKTTKLSETTKSEVAKATESFRQKADFYDKLSQREDFVKQWNEYVERSAAQTETGEEDPKLQEIREKLNQVESKLQRTELLEVTDAFAEAVDDKGEKMHPDFDRLNEIDLGALGSGAEAQKYSLLRAAIELATGENPQERLANGYKNAKKIYDEIFEAGRKAALGRIQGKIQGSTQPPSGVPSSGMTTTDKKPKTAREALELAKKGILVSRD